MDKKVAEQLSEAEIAERMTRGLKKSLTMPHTPHKAAAPKGKTRPQSKGRVRKAKSSS